MGVVGGGWQMARAAGIAHDLLRRAEANEGFAPAKIATARFYADHILPEAGAYCHKVTAGAASTLALEVMLFARSNAFTRAVPKSTWRTCTLMRRGKNPPIRIRKMACRSWHSHPRESPRRRGFERDHQ
jgi:Acetyl-CoA dehydrogenase C-terminal like